MVSIEQLKEMSKPPLDGKAYYRPLICNGDLNNVDIFFVGTNPATPIFPSDMELEIYSTLLLNYDEFIKYYKSNRLENGKDEVSRTRIGMNSFFSWLRSITDVSIAETEVIPYPTAKLKELKREPMYIIDRGKEIFYQLVSKFKPSLLILHGKKTVEHAIDIFEKKGSIERGSVNLETTIEEMEKYSPILQFTYPNGKIGTVMVCRHFMYYGSSGESYREFREKVADNLRG